HDDERVIPGAIATSGASHGHQPYAARRSGGEPVTPAVILRGPVRGHDGGWFGDHAEPGRVQTVRQFPDMKEYVALPRVLSLRLSPDGTRLVSVVQSLNP